jgi:hypothetical protein
MSVPGMVYCHMIKPVLLYTRGNLNFTGSRHDVQAQVHALFQTFHDQRLPHPFQRKLLQLIPA